MQEKNAREAKIFLRAGGCTHACFECGAKAGEYHEFKTPSHMRSRLERDLA